jgi:SnoaL-like protein
MTEGITDRQLIIDQLARYAYTFDSHDADGWAAVFTDDGVFEVTQYGSDARMFQIQGSEQLRAFASSAPHLLHHITNVVFDELLPDSARTRAMVLGTWASPADGNPAIYTHGTYEQQWSKVQGQWRLAHQLFVSSGYDRVALQALAAAPMASEASGVNSNRSNLVAAT